MKPLIKIFSKRTVKSILNVLRTYEADFQQTKRFVYHDAILRRDDIARKIGPISIPYIDKDSNDPYRENRKYIAYSTLPGTIEYINTLRIKMTNE